MSMMALFTFIFTYLIHFNISGHYPKMVFFCAALLPWTFFSSSLNYSVSSLRDNYDLITKIYFPREILPLAGIVNALIDYSIAFVVFVLLLVVYDINITSNVFWLVPLFVLLFMFTIAVSLVLSSLNVYYRDVQLAIHFLIQLWFFASPVLYSIDKVSMKLKLLLFLNPLTFIIENMRRCMVEGRGVVLWQLAVVTALIAAAYLLAYKFFRRTERAFADVI